MPPAPVPVGPCEAGMCPDDGDVCNGLERCDPKTNTCVRSEPLACDDGLVCNGIETCDPKLGCVAGDAVTCEAPGERCDENTGRCACEPPFLPPDCRVKTALFAPFGTVRDLAEEPGVLWATTTTGLWALDFAGTPDNPGDDHWTHFAELLAASDSGKLAIDGHGAKWFAGNGERQLVRLDDGGTPSSPGDDSWLFYGAPDAFSPSALGVDTAGNAWLGGYGDTLTFSDAGTPSDRTDDAWLQLSQLGAPEPLASAASVNAILTEPPGVVWFGAATGELFAYDLERGRFSDLSDARWSRVNDLAWGDGTLWAAVDSGAPSQPAVVGLPVDAPVATLSTADSVMIAAPHPVQALAADAGGLLWASDGGSSFSCLDSATAAWSSWELGFSVASILTRSRHDSWLGGDGVFHLEHGGSCAPRTDGLVNLGPKEALQSDARDVAIEGRGVWLATDRGVDYFDTGGTPLDPSDDRWVHFDALEVPGLEDLQGVLVAPSGTKYFWGQTGVFSLDDRGTPFEKSDDAWVSHATGSLWVSGVLDADGRLLIVGRTNDDPSGTAKVVVFDPAGTPDDGSDDVVTTLDSGVPGIGRNMTLDSNGRIWLGTETPGAGGNLYHWDRRGTPLDGSDDVWTPVRAQNERVWKLEADPTGGIWGTVAEGVFQFYDNGTPTDPSDDYWHVYPELGSAMDIGPGGVGWFRMRGGVGVLDTGGTPRDASDDVAKVLLSPDALRFRSNLYTNGVIDDEGRFWVAGGDVQVFEFVE